MKRKPFVIIAAIALCLVLSQAAFASDVEYPNVYKPFYVAETYSLEDALWFHPTLYSVDVLTFLQAYLRPDNAYSYFMKAAQYTDDDIEENFIIYQAFIESELAGRISFKYSCDIDEFAKDYEYYLDPSYQYEVSILFEDPEDIIEMFPRGIGRANAYDTFRRTALQLAIYVAKNGETPGFGLCDLIIQETIAWYEQAFDEAMESEAALNMEVVVIESQDNF